MRISIVEPARGGNEKYQFCSITDPFAVYRGRLTRYLHPTDLLGALPRPPCFVEHSLTSEFDEFSTSIAVAPPRFTMNWRVCLKSVPYQFATLLPVELNALHNRRPDF